MVRYSLENKVAVITGGAQGIGLAITKAFLQKGVKTVIILDVNEGIVIANELNKEYGTDKVIYMKCDVINDLETVSNNIFAKYKVGILVNNAGIGNERLIRRTIEINTIAVIEWSLKFQEHMRESNNGGTIINISSGYGFIIDQFVPVYKASKFAVMGFSWTLGHIKNFNRSKVRVIVLCPGFTDTNLLKKFDVEEEVAVEWKELQKDAGTQSTEVVGKAAVEVYEKAESGTAWHIFDSNPVMEINYNTL